MTNIILASKSKVRKEILEKNKIHCLVEPSNVDEDSVKNSLLNEGASFSGRERNCFFQNIGEGEVGDIWKIML